MSHDIPKQVRIRTDPDDGYAHRYEAVQLAKGVFGVGNNTDAIIHACDHSARDVNAKRDAISYLARNVPADVLAETIDRLSTRKLPIEVDLETDAGDVHVDVRIGPDGDATGNDLPPRREL